MGMPCRLTNHIDNSAIVLALHDRNDSLGHQEKSKHLIAQLPFKGTQTGVLYGPTQMGARVVDQDINASPFVIDGLGQSTNGLCVGDIGGQGQHLTSTLAQGCCRLLQPVVVTGTNGHLTTFGQKFFCNGFTNAARSARDDRHFPIQSQFQNILLCLCQ